MVYVQESEEISENMEEDVVRLVSVSKCDKGIIAEYLLCYIYLVLWHLLALDNNRKESQFYRFISIIDL